MKVVSGTFISTTNATNVECGFIPDYIRLWSALGGTELCIEWFKCLADAATTGQYGCLDTAGVKSMCSDANNGIIEYDTSSTQYVWLTAPGGSGKVKKALSADFVAGVTQPTARSTSVCGTTVRPSTHNGYVYECTTSAGVYGTEPTWGTVVGATTSDGTNTWTCRMEETVAAGCQGFVVGATISTDGEIWVFKAEKHDMTGDLGDSDSENPVRF
ncbi:MAG: hypothetical protein IMZ53_03745 [Thermoplasmata archaeon]|nr:hypothetical protein [Thermoplasmata archaeon]